MNKKSLFFAIFTILIFNLNSGLIFAEEEQGDSIDPIIIFTDKATYLPEESIVISGEVTKRKMPLIAIRVFDPDDKILCGYNVELDENNQFLKTIIADIPFYEKPGIYRITAEYGKNEAEAIFKIENESFGIEATDPKVEDEAKVEEPEPIPQITLFETDKETYQDDDTISIIGKVSKTSHPQVTITIFDPYNVPTGIYLANVNPDLTFSTSFLAKYNTNFKIIGVYSITAQYGGPETKQIRTIQFVEQVNVPEVTETTQTHSSLLSESDWQHLSSWYYLDGTDDELALFFKELVKRDLINLDASITLSQDFLLQWIKINNSSLSSMINDLFEEKISEGKFILLVENSLDNQIKNTSSNIVNKIPPPSVNSETISKIEISEVTDSKKSENISTEIKNDTTIESEEEITYFHSNINCEKSEYEDVILQYNNPGPALARLCKYEDAVSYYAKTLEHEPENFYALTNTGSALANLGKYADAILYYNKVLEIDPQYLAALNNKGNALANLGNYQEAISYYNKVLGIDPQYLPTLSNKEKASTSLEVFQITEEPQTLPISEHIIEFKEQEHPVENENESKDIMSQFANALSSIRTSLIALFGG